MYDLTIATPLDWPGLQQQGLGVIVDPCIYRLGQIFLDGAHAAGEKKEIRWHALENDLGALVNFFDLIVLNDRLAAFNYTDTFDKDLNFDESLGARVNRGDKTLVSVDVTYGPYVATKEAAVNQLRSRMADGPFVPAAAAKDILMTLDTIEYEWEPGLLGLEEELPGDESLRLAQFLGGVLVFAGYAQQSGATHILAPRRSRLVAAAGVRADRADATVEAEVFQEVRTRLSDAGAGWREGDLPWTPSFLPFLLQQMKSDEGPDILLDRAKDLRDSKAVGHYRKLRQTIMSDDAEHSNEALQELEVAADEMTQALGSTRQELEHTRYVFVEVLPKVFGIGAGAGLGALIGTALAGPLGAVAGGLAGLVGEEALKPVQKRLWGWVLDTLPFYSARKLLTRSVKAEHELSNELGNKLRAVWEIGPQEE